LCAGAEIVADLAAKIARRVVAQVLGLLGVDHAVQHQRIDGVERPRRYHVPEGIRIAISDPFLPPGADSGKAVILAAAPDGIRVTQPEGRWIGARGEIDVQVGPRLPQIADEVNGSVEIAVELASGAHLVGVAGAIELELIDAEFGYHRWMGVRSGKYSSAGI